jgi:hypothetical protein
MTSGRKFNEKQAVSDINQVFNLNRKEARESYKEEFGRRIDDPSIDDELESFFVDAVTDGKDIVAVPARLALALVLRPRGRGRGRQRPPKEIAAARLERSAISFANRRWAELAQSQHSKAAKHQAAQEAHAKFGRVARVGMETIKHKMNLKKGKAALTRR